LEKEEKLDLREKILMGEVLGEQDFKDLEEYRLRIKEALDFSQEILTKLTPETIKIIASSSADFNKLVGQIGIEKVKPFLEVYLSRLYIIDQSKFNDLRKKLMQ